MIRFRTKVQAQQRPGRISRQHGGGTSSFSRSLRNWPHVRHACLMLRRTAGVLLSSQETTLPKYLNCETWRRGSP